MQNRISAEFTPAQVEAVMGLITQIEDAMALLETATTEDWTELNKLGPKSRAFAEACDLSPDPSGAAPGGGTRRPRALHAGPVPLRRTPRPFKGTPCPLKGTPRD